MIFGKDRDPTFSIQPDSHIPRINKRKDMIEATGVATL
jgi:hypothetical protein